MANLGAFNANEHEELQDFTAMPAGEYVGRIVASEMKRNRQDTGSFLKLEFEISEGKFKGRKLWTNLNLDHPNADAVNIAHRELATICKAVGIISPGDSEELHGIDMTLKVAVKPATANYPETNEIKTYKALDGVARPAGVTKPQASDEGDAPKTKRRVSFD